MRCEQNAQISTCDQAGHAFPFVLLWILEECVNLGCDAVLKFLCRLQVSTPRKDANLLGFGRGSELFRYRYATLMVQWPNENKDQL